MVAGAALRQGTFGILAVLLWVALAPGHGGASRRDTVAGRVVCVRGEGGANILGVIHKRLVIPLQEYENLIQSKMKRARGARLLELQKLLRLVRRRAQRLGNFCQLTVQPTPSSPPAFPPPTSGTPDNPAPTVAPESSPTVIPSPSSLPEASPTPTASIDPTATPQITAAATPPLGGCGDARLDLGEQCDGELLAGKTCQLLGFLSGILRCTPTCRYDVDACEIAQQTLWVDASLPSDCESGEYSIASRSCTGADGIAYRTIQTAVERATPGTTIEVRGGVYRERVVIDRSGLSDHARITLRGFRPDGTHAAVIDGERIRSNGLYIGSCGRGDFVTIEGLVIRNIRSGSGDGGISIHGAVGVEVRHNEIYNESWAGQDYGKGISFSGPTDDLLIEGNVIYYVQQGIVGRHSPSGDCRGEPRAPTIRLNHVHHIHVEDVLQQNHAFGISMSNGVHDALVEMNIVHHVDDFAVGTNETFGPTSVARNIVFGADYLNGGGGGDGIKIKPIPSGYSYHDTVAFNVAFMNRAAGIHIIPYQRQWGAFAYHNTTVSNSEGLSFSTNQDAPAEISIVMNNIMAFNINDDVPPQVIDAAAGSFDFNLIRIRPYAARPGTETSSVAGTISAPLDPQLDGLGLLEDTIDLANGGFIPRALLPLAATREHPVWWSGQAFYGFENGEEAFRFAQSAVAAIFMPRLSSPARDRGTEVGADDGDILGTYRQGSPDIGAIEVISR